MDPNYGISPVLSLVTTEAENSSELILVNLFPMTQQCRVGSCSVACMYSVQSILRRRIRTGQARQDKMMAGGPLERSERTPPGRAGIH